MASHLQRRARLVVAVLQFGFRVSEVALRRDLRERAPLLVVGSGGLAYPQSSLESTIFSCDLGLQPSLESTVFSCDFGLALQDVGGQVGGQDSGQDVLGKRRSKPGRLRSGSMVARPRGFQSRGLGVQTLLRPRVHLGVARHVGMQTLQRPGVHPSGMSILAANVGISAKPKGIRLLR